MNIKPPFCLVFFFVLYASTSIAQRNYQFGLLPAINLNKKLDKGFKLNFKAESRQIIYKEERANFDSELVDLAAITSKKIGLNSSLAGGYLLRIRNNEIIHRLIQQFTITQQGSILRIGHRFSSDQTFTNQSVAYRFRYRISSQVPLNGQSVNAREFYLKVNNEYLNAIKDSSYDLEIRLAIILGYEFNDNNKLELGIENRADDFIEEDLRNRSWMKFSWFVAI